MVCHIVGGSPLQPCHRQVEFLLKAQASVREHPPQQLIRLQLPSPDHGHQVLYDIAYLSNLSAVFKESPAHCTNHPPFSLPGQHGMGVESGIAQPDIGRQLMDHLPLAHDDIQGNLIRRAVQVPKQLQHGRLRTGPAHGVNHEQNLFPHWPPPAAWSAPPARASCARSPGSAWPPAWQAPGSSYLTGKSPGCSAPP